MTEDFLHYAWRYRRFQQRGLHCTLGLPIEILHPGQHNHHAGPDFSNARIRIDDTQWAGNVEIHIRSSEWYRHSHEEDPAYANVILHVVLEEDLPVFNAQGQRIPCLELKPLLDPQAMQRYHQLLYESAWIPCQSLWPQVPELTKTLWIERLLVERLEAKTEHIQHLLTLNRGDWEETCYQVLARAFGMKVNAEPFEQLARSLPYKLMAKHGDNLLQIEALLFTQAGMLEGLYREKYPRTLQQEGRFLRHKYSLKPMDGSQWKFLRMRPANFPTVRLAQFAALVYRSEHLFSKILASSNVDELRPLLLGRPSPYWTNHYQFDQPTKYHAKPPGETFFQLLIINAIAPLLFFYGVYHQDAAFCERAMLWLESMPSEDNHVLTGWQQMGCQAQNAGEGQALMHLKSSYCEQKRCLNCAVGNAIVQGVGLDVEQDEKVKRERELVFQSA